MTILSFGCPSKHDFSNDAGTFQLKSGGLLTMRMGDNLLDVVARASPLRGDRGLPPKGAEGMGRQIRKAASSAA